MTATINVRQCHKRRKGNDNLVKLAYNRPYVAEVYLKIYRRTYLSVRQIHHLFWLLAFISKCLKPSVSHKTFASGTGCTAATARTRRRREHKFNIIRSRRLLSNSNLINKRMNRGYIGTILTEYVVAGQLVFNNTTILFQFQNILQRDNLC